MNRILTAAFPVLVLVAVFAAAPMARGQDDPGGGKTVLSLDDLFPQRRVLDVRIDVSPEDWDTVRNQSRDFLTALHARRRLEPPPSPYTYVEAKVTIDGVSFPKVGLRKKGFLGSLSRSRPSLKVKLDHTDPEGGIQGLTTLTLNNNLQDESLVSQYLTYRLFNAIGSPAPRCAFAKVTVNGESLGVYAHVESVRGTVLERGFGDATGTLYEGTVVDFFEGWEGSFEHKLGDDEAGRKKIKELIAALDPGEGETVLPADSPGWMWVPTHGRHDKRWMRRDFDHSSWTPGRGGVGYDNEDTFRPAIGDGFDVREKMYNRRESVYVRIPFEIDDPKKVAAEGRLVLRVRYDDGFVAWLNGRRVAARNAPGEVRWDSKAVGPHGDEAAMRFESIDISEHEGLLRRGRNVLALQGLNIDAASSDLLLAAALQTNDHDVSAAIAELVDLDAFYTFWALEGLLGWWDGYAANKNNYFIYLHPKSKRFHFMPWGADALFTKENPLGEIPGRPQSVWTAGLVAHRLYQLESGRKRYEETLRGLLKKHWDEEALLAETSRVEKMLRPHVAPSQKEFAEKLEDVREFIRARRGELLAEIEDGMPVWSRPPEPPITIGEDFAPDGGEETIWAAARRGDVKAIAKQLEAGTDVDAGDDQGTSALGHAALAGRTEAVRFLIDKGAEVNRRSPDGGTALHGAAFMGCVEVVRLLLEKGADVQIRDGEGQSAHDVATLPWEEIRGIVEFIITIYRLDVRVDDVERSRPRAAALLKKQSTTAGGEPRLSQPKKKDDIWTAAKTGDATAVAKHIAAGADPDGRDSSGITPISWAAMQGHLAVVETLLAKGGKPDARNADGATALHSAAFLGRLDVVRLLLEKKASVNVRNREGETPLGTVAPEWNGGVKWITELIIKMLKLDADVEAIRKARPKIARVLRKHGGKTGDQLN